MGAELIPVISYSPDFVSDSGTAPSIDGGFGGGRTGIPAPDGAKSGGSLFIKVIDCVYGLGKTQIGWVNGNPYYGAFHVHPTTGVKMVGATHTNTPHATIYNSKEESLGQAAPVTYTQSTTTEPSTPQANVSSTTVQSTTSDTTPTPQVEPQQTTQQPYTPPTNNNTNTGGSSGTSGGGGY